MRIKAITSACRKGHVPPAEWHPPGMLLCCGGSKHTPCMQVRDAGSCFRDQPLARTGTEVPQPTALGDPTVFVHFGLPALPQPRGDGSTHPAQCGFWSAWIPLTPQGPVPDPGSRLRQSLRPPRDPHEELTSPVCSWGVSPKDPKGPCEKAALQLGSKPPSPVPAAPLTWE